MTGIEKLQEKMNIGDGAVICDEYNRRYFTGFESSNGVLAVTKTDAVFFTDFRYIEAAKNSISTAEVRILEASHSAAVISVFEKEEINFQTAELGKVDLGGGGTIAYILALYGMNVIDSGVAVLNMHAPWEATSKADVYETKRGYVAFLKGAEM